MSSSPEETAATPVVVTVSADGPYLVSGPVEIRNPAGALVKSVDRAALCRCGNSGNKPFCDGSHRRVGFTDPGPAAAEG
jgi:CDGSH-type Zn-finger protein